MGNPYPGYPVSPRQGGKKDRHRECLCITSNDPVLKVRACALGSLSPSDEMELNELLGGRYRPTAVWDVSQDVSTALHVHGRNAFEKVSEALLSNPATDPPVSRMRIVSNDFPWDINMVLNRNEIVTVGHVLGAIYGTLQKPMEKEDWDDKTSNGKRSLHRTRCVRLARGAASFKVDSHIKQVDFLGDKTFFMGLKAVGSIDQPEEWLLKLGPPPRQGRR